MWANLCEHKTKPSILKYIKKSFYKTGIFVNKYQIKLIILLAISIFTQNVRAEEAVNIVPIEVTNYDFHEQFKAIGQCKSENSKTYYAKSEGSVDSISISQGQNVIKGQELISIDGDIARANKAKAKAAYKSALSNYNRDLSLFNKKFISEEVINKSKVDLESAKSELANAQSKFDDMIITAPFDGHVGVVRARIGDNVKAGDYLLSLVANGDKTVFVELPENLLGKISDKSEVFALDINSKKIPGKIIATSNYLNDSGTMTAKLLFNADSKMIHGSYVEIILIYNQHQGLALPEKTILKNKNGDFVYAITEENTVKKIHIETGSRTEQMIEIKSDDLKLGDKIVLEGLTKIYNGSKVKF